MTKLPDPESLRAILTDRFGLALSVSVGEDAEGAFVDIAPRDLHENEGFVIRTVIGWRGVRARFRAGRFAGDLVSDIAGASAEKRAQFAAVARALRDKGALITLRINGSATDPFAPNSWPSSWTSLDLEVDRTPVMLDHDSPDDVRDAILSWAGGLMSMLVCLLPVEDIEPKEQLDLAGFPEGAKQRVEVNRYERSRLNRAVCISVHGTKCAVCGFDFQSAYGALGRDFIHVHHKVPVSLIGAEYVINPVMDLVPVCPNCHAMLHRQNPPIEIEDLKVLLHKPKQVSAQ